MTLGTILYILLFFVSVFISIMYLEFGAMALMGLMVTIPVSYTHLTLPTIRLV